MERHLSYLNKKVGNKCWEQIFLCCFWCFLPGEGNTVKVTILASFCPFICSAPEKNWNDFVGMANLWRIAWVCHFSSSLFFLGKSCERGSPSHGEDPLKS